MRKLSSRQRYKRAVESMERAATDLLYFVETYKANDPNNPGYHASKRRELFEKARAYTATLRRLARVAS